MIECSQVRQPTTDKIKGGYRELRNGAIHTRRRQIFHESNKHWFWSMISNPFCSKISVNPVHIENIHSFVWENVLKIFIGTKPHLDKVSILMNRGRECLPPFQTDRMDLCTICSWKSRIILLVSRSERRGTWFHVLARTMPVWRLNAVFRPFKTVAHRLKSADF